MRPLLNPEGLQWDVTLEVLANSGSFEYSAYLIRKRRVETPDEDGAAATG